MSKMTVAELIDTLKNYDDDAKGDKKSLEKV